MKIVKKIIFSTLFVCLLCMATVILIELTFTILLNNSSLLSGNLLTHFRSYYMKSDRKIIQYSADCAIYDSELAYILKPGECQIKNREFEVDYFINSLGVRDDESALHAPQVVVIGDSLAMGWGVKQDLIFSSLLQDILNKSVLNTAISSYGTVRELKILERVNLENLEYLIIQYCDNDFLENEVFRRNGNVLPIMPEDLFVSYQEEHKNNQAYYFGKHAFNITKNFIKSINTGTALSSQQTNSGKNIVNATEWEVYSFLNAISHSSINLSGTIIIVFEVNGSAINDSAFINTLNKRLASEQATHPEFKNIHAFDFSSILGRDEYFHLDDHINSRGHHAIAEALSEIILKLPDRGN